MIFALGNLILLLASYQTGVQKDKCKENPKMYVEFLLEDSPALSQMLVTCSLPDLSFDLRRMLRIQWKEFLYYLEEGPDDLMRGDHGVNAGGLTFL